MLLSIQKLEIKKIPFDTTYEPGKLDFAESGLTQLTPLHATGEAELLENTGGEVRVQGHISVTMGADCDRCLAKAQFAIDAPFDLFYEPSSAVENEDEIAISEGAAEIGFYNGSGIELEEILQEQVLLMTADAPFVQRGLPGNLSDLREEPQRSILPLQRGSG